MSIFQFNAINKKCQSHAPGFLLIELLVSLLLMALFMFVIAGYQNLIIRWMHEARARITAVNHVSSFLEIAAVNSAVLSKTYQQNSTTITPQLHSFQPLHLPHGFTAPRATVLVAAVAWDGFEQKKHTSSFCTISVD